MWFVYLLFSKTLNRYYTGITTRPEQRLRAHNGKGGAKATRGGRPWSMCVLSALDSKGDALREEYRLKRLSHAEKARLYEAKKSQDLREQPLAGR
jgi:putative endonuclease